MKNLIPRFAFGACVCLIVSCLVVFNFQSKAAPPSQPRSVQVETNNTDASPVAVPEPSLRAVSFHHSTMLLIAVVILWNLLIPTGFLFAGFSAKLRSWAEKVGRQWYFSYAIYYTAFSLIFKDSDCRTIHAIFSYLNIF